MKDIKFVVVTTTFDKEVDACALAKDIIKHRLAACVQLAPIHSIYHWQGKVETGPEYLLSAKTLIVLADKLMTFIRSQHSHEIPEIILLPIIGGEHAYLDWIEREIDSQLS